MIKLACVAMPINFCLTRQNPQRQVSNVTGPMSRIMRKPAFCIFENKAADQLCSNCTAEQRLRFHLKDSIIPLLPKSKISCL